MHSCTGRKFLTGIAAGAFISLKKINRKEYMER